MMDFIIGLPVAREGCDSIWVMIDRLTKSAHFLPVKTRYSVEKLAKIYIKKIIRLHGIPQSIVSDREHLGTKLQFSTATHPQTDGQSERVIQTLEDMLCACALNFSGN